jgi:carbonic anhydrase/acetyltransferase-like protein (isoleucine patch superfamily)
MPIYEIDGIRPELPAPGRCFIAPDAVIIGRVKIEEGASIWFNAVLRGDNEFIRVGAGSNIQDSCVLHTDMGFPLMIGAGCTIGHGVILHGCTIGGNSLIGMGAVVLNGARIGENSIVGAGALVTEGKEFPDHSLVVGSPARVIRKVEARAIEMLREAAKIYSDRWPHYAESLRRVD